MLKPANIYRWKDISKLIAPNDRIVIWDKLVDLFGSREVMWFSVDRGGNWMELPESLKPILKQNISETEWGHFGIYLEM